MTSEELESYPPLPPSVAEWEDLLVRLEIAPRAVRNLLEEWEGGADTVGVLRAAVAREAGVGHWLETAAGVADTIAPAPDTLHADAGALALRFAALRARTFAMLQRRGLEVWAWEGETGDGGTVTVYQLIGWLVERDGVLLAGLRQGARVGGRTAGPRQRESPAAC